MEHPSRPAPEGDRPGREAEATPPAAGELTPLRELQLVRDHQAGDPDALGELLGAYQRRVYGICYRMAGDAERAADLTQDAFVRIIEGLSSYEARSRLSTWIVRVTMNSCLSRMRREKLRRHAGLEEAVTADSGAGGELSGPRRVEQDEMKDVLLRALSMLEPSMRAILVLRDLQQLDYSQIGEVLEVPLGTVKSRIFRARAALREAVDELTGAPPQG